MKQKHALITGIFGQDGSYLTELLLSKGYAVFGFVRPGDTFPHELSSIYERVTLCEGDMGDSASILRAVRAAEPDEVYNLASPSSVVTSLEHPVSTSDATALGPTRILEALRDVCPRARFFQASSSEIFGTAAVSPQTEQTIGAPRNPYGVAKLFAHQMVHVFRKQFGIYAVAGILYNHESPRRGEGFVTRKITSGVARIKHGLATELVLGDLNARRDWGYAPEYVEAMWRMLQQETPEDFVIATGETHSVGEFAAEAFSHVGLDWRAYVRTDPQLLRRGDDVLMVGDTKKAREKLSWRVEKSFKDIVRVMVDADMLRIEMAAHSNAPRFSLHT